MLRSPTMLRSPGRSTDGAPAPGSNNASRAERGFLTARVLFLALLLCPLVSESAPPEVDYEHRVVLNDQAPGSSGGSMVELGTSLYATQNGTVTEYGWPADGSLNFIRDQSHSPAIFELATDGSELFFARTLFGSPPVHEVGSLRLANLNVRDAVVTPEQVKDLIADDSFIYAIISTGNIFYNTVDAIDRSNLSNLVTTASIPVPRTHSLAQSDTHVFVSAGYSDGPYLFAKDPVAGLIYVTDMAIGGWCLAYRDGYLYTGFVDGIRQYDVSDPANPVETAYCNTSNLVGSIGSVFPTATKVYFQGKGAMGSIDLLAPTVLEGVMRPWGSFASRNAIVSDDRFVIRTSGNDFLSATIVQPVTTFSVGLESWLETSEAYDLSLVDDVPFVLRERAVECCEGDVDLFQELRRESFGGTSAFLWLPDGVAHRVDMGTLDFGAVIGDWGISSVRSSAPTSVTSRGDLALPAPGNDVAVHGSTAYVTTASGIQVVDLAPSPPTLGALIPTGTSLFDCVVAGGTLWAAAGPSGLQAFNLATPSSPTAIGTLPFGTDVQTLSVHSDRAVAFDAGGTVVYILDVGTPIAPSLLGSVDTGVSLEAASTFGATAYFGYHDDLLGPQEDPVGGFLVVDHSNPTLPFVRELVAHDIDHNFYYTAAIVSNAHGLHVLSDNALSGPNLSGKGRLELYGNQLGTATGVVAIAAEPGVVFLPPVPNPSSGATRFRFVSNVQGMVPLEITDVSGRIVRRLRHHVVSAGQQSILWDGHEDSGGIVAAGVYFVRAPTLSRAAQKVVRLR